MEIVKFLNLSPQNSKGLHVPLYRNAKKLYNDALLITDINKSYSTSVSLLILSSEEIVKAILVLMHSEGYKVYQIDSAKKFFHDHKIRHQIAQLIESGTGLFEMMIVWEEERKKKIINTKAKWLNDLVHFIKDGYKAIQPMLKTKERIEKLEQFNDLKNQGLYVNYENGIIDPQNQILKEDFEEVHQMVKRIFYYYKGLRVFFHPMLKNHIPKSEIEQGKKDLKFFVEDAMKGFSFKDLKT
ncbi:AbiV family abortive infection protein [Pontimicrobium sp. SW4]|uniref:AbiV family abortive infection protein n=1 Tax=Pontimicrobium sp. SW4 TaxID=3153519 RepID=A0AAU7BSG4_9FLAO